MGLIDAMAGGLEQVPRANKYHRHFELLPLFAAVLDMSHDDAVQLLRQAQYSEARFLIVHGGPHFRYHALEPKALARQEVIAVMAWESDRWLDKVHRIIVDQPAGSRLVADYLWDAGHRHVLLAGPGDMIARATAWDGQGQCPPQHQVQGAGLAPEWRARGGRITMLDCIHERLQHPPFDAQRLLAILDGVAPPTAVFGLRDVDTWDIREGLRHLRPPFSTLNWQLDEVVELACGVIRQVKEGRAFAAPVVRQITPRLVPRHP